MQLSPSQYRMHMYHIDMSTSKSSVEDTQGVSMDTDQGQVQMRSSGIESSSTSRIQIPRSMISSGIDTGSMSRIQISQNVCRPCLYQEDMFLSDDDQEVPAKAAEGQSLLQEHENDIALTSQDVLCDLLETQRVSLSSYINVVKKRLLSSLGVIKTPVSGRKVRVGGCGPPK